MKQLVTLTISACLAAVTAHASINEVWTFSEANESPISKCASSLATPFANGQSPIVHVKDGQLEFMCDGVEEHTFRQQAFANGPFSSGIVELSWVFTSVDFSRTVAAGGSANVGFDVRDLNGTLKSPKDDKVFGVLRLRCEKGGLLLQYSQSAKGSADAWTSIASMGTATVDEPLKVRMRFDLDNPTRPGAFQIFLQLGDEEEMLSLSDGTLPAAGSISGYRIIQQTVNGKNSWQAGDTVTIDDFTLSVGG